MLVALLTVIGAWLIAFGAIAGLGQFARRAFRLTRADSAGWFDAFWIGYVIVIGVLAIWHLCLPIDWRATAVLGVFGLIGFGLALRQPRRLLPLRPRWRTMLATVLTIGLLVPVALWIVSRALDSQLDFDTGLYHLSTIHWLNVYPAVPGLGNLHYRLAFNQSFFTFVAALNVYPYFDQGFHVANSLLTMVLIAQMGRGAIDALLTRPWSPRATPERWLGTLLLPIVLYRATHQPYSANMSSASPDLIIFLLQIVALLAFVRLLFLPSDDELVAASADHNRRAFTAFFVIGVSAVGVTSKLSFAAFGLSLIGLTVIAWLWSHRPRRSVRQRARLIGAGRQAALWLIVIGAGVGLPWIADGVVASGYPLFPSTVGALPVDYRIPAPIATDAADWVRSFARDPHGDEQTVLSSWAWLPTWQGLMEESFNQFLFAIPLYLFLAVLGIFAILLIAVQAINLRLRHRLRRLYPYRAIVPLIPAALSAGFWFWSAPDPRFAGSAFWLLATCALLMLILLLPAKIPGWLSVPIVIAPLIAAAAIVAINFGTDVSFDGDGFPRLPQASIAVYQTDSGLSVNISGNPNDTLELWDAPLPASPYKLPALELRGSDLKDGFRMAGTR